MQRPGAVEQLQVLGERSASRCSPSRAATRSTICDRGTEEARKLRSATSIIYDTAGRLAIDEAADGGARARSEEHAKPENILLVVDAMIGQDAVKTAAAFNERL